MADDRFEPWLGTISGGEPVLSRLRARSLRLGWTPGAVVSRGVKGHRMRGAGVACVLKASQAMRPCHRSAGVSTRIVKLHGAGRQSVYQHLRYLGREGKGRTGECPELYSDRPENSQRLEFSELTADHRHQFRMVVEPQDGWEYPNFKPLVHKLMKQVAQDLRVDLDWVAADHFDNGAPHAHIAVAGRDRQGENILIAPLYLQQGLTRRVAEIVSLDLGPKVEHEAGPEIDLTAEKVLTVDIELLSRADPTGLVVQDPADGAHQGVLTRRLMTLGALGLATRQSHGSWRLREDILVELGKIEEQNRRWSGLQQQVSDRHADRPRSDYAIWDDRRDRPVIGRVLAANPLPGDEHEIIIDTVEGELMRAQGCTDLTLRPDMIVMLGTNKGGAREVAPRVEPPRALEIALLSERPLEQLVEGPGANWLDDIASQAEPPWLGKGFGEEVRRSLIERDLWLRSHSIEQARDPETDVGLDWTPSLSQGVRQALDRFI